MTTTQSRRDPASTGFHPATLIALLAILMGLLDLAACGGPSNGSTTVAITSLTADPSNIEGSGTSTLKWSAVQADRCELAGGTLQQGKTVKSTDSYTTPTLTSTTKYTLHCSSTTSSASQDVQVTVTPTTATTTTAASSTTTTTTTTPTTTTAETTTTTTAPTTTTTTAPTTTTTTPTPTTTTTTTPTTTTTAAAPTPTYASVASACAATPMLSGTVHYYCDCGTGAQAGCVAGSDTNAGTSPSLPRRTIANAATMLRSGAAVNDTVALCKGGAFNVTGTLNIGSTRCAAGTTCNDLREYTPPTFSGTAKPIINNLAGAATLFQIAGNYGGIRLLNLKLNGDGGAIGNNNWGFFFYQGAHDVTMCNLDMDGFDIAVDNEGGAGINSNIKLTGNHITNSRKQGSLGSGDNFEISYNYWDGNGSSNAFDHTIYMGSHYRAVLNSKIIGNYIHGQYGPTCLGTVINVQGEFDGLAVNGNQVYIDSNAAAPGCWGIDLATGGYSVPAFFRHTSVSGNIVKNGGNLALSVVSCPNCLIENNLIIQDWALASTLRGIMVPATTRTGYGDDVNTQNTIRNNTIYYGPNVKGNAAGITVAQEGTGHVIANNTVYYTAASAGQTVSCYTYSLPLASYAFINNNHCYSAAPYSWVATRGSLAAWQSYAAASGFAFDTASASGNSVFTAPGTDFTPSSGSILLGKGNAAYGATYDITGKLRPQPPSIGAYER